ncbi:hypothetical protein Q8A67_021449 [Cirrhinus molitorella]|uniref:Uncharacterized protein n=1 Tax=Cirrhinus molitorella TaxID=172907 RepID=A0AA88P8J2_9TELE|nr:hypothetical protein Q8A67_021449 [Cirrhinus molitorella]
MRSDPSLPFYPCSLATRGRGVVRAHERLRAMMLMVVIKGFHSFERRKRGVPLSLSLGADGPWQDGSCHMAPGRNGGKVSPPCSSPLPMSVIFPALSSSALFSEYKRCSPTALMTLLRICSLTFVPIRTYTRGSFAVLLFPSSQE